MKPLNMVFELVRKFVPMDENEYAKLQDEGMRWDAKITDDDENKLKAFYAKYSRMWGVRLLCAIAYLWFVRKIPQWINPEIYEEEED